MIKIDPYDIKCVHGSFYEKSDNQIDILENLRSAVTQLSNLADFKGAAADSVKNYMVDVHTQIINSFETLLMEMEVKLLMLYQDFNSSVDLSENSVVCDDYLNEVIYDMNEIIKPSHYYSTYTGSVLKSINDIIYLKAPQWDEFIEQIKSAKAVAESTLEQLVNFENRHINDMDNINDTLSKIESACLYIYNTKNITNYKADSVCENEWYEELSKCQLNSFNYASTIDPNLTKIYVDKININEFISKALEFMIKEIEKGTFDYNDLIPLISVLNLINDENLCVESLLGNSDNSLTFETIEKGLSDLMKAMDKVEISNLIASKSLIDALKEGIDNLDVKDWWIYIFTIAVDVAGAFYDERTQSWSDFDEAEFMAGFTVDSLCFITPVIAGIAAGSFIPGIGNAVGAFVGIIIASINVVKYGEPPQSFFDRSTGTLEHIYGDIENWFSKVFW